MKVQIVLRTRITQKHLLTLDATQIIKALNGELKLNVPANAEVRVGDLTIDHNDPICVEWTEEKEEVKEEQRECGG